jgi:hypothetical protein
LHQKIRKNFLFLPLDFFLPHFIKEFPPQPHSPRLDSRASLDFLKFNLKFNFSIHASLNSFETFFHEVKKWLLSAELLYSSGSKNRKRTFHFCVYIFVLAPFSLISPLVNDAKTLFM